MVNLCKNLRPFQNCNLKIQWEIHFFTFLNIGRNSSKKLEYKYGHSHFKSAFGINFRLQEVVKGKYGNARICVFSILQLSEVQN